MVLRNRLHSERAVSFIVGVDIGGTFTDATAVSTRDGTVYEAKAPTTPTDLVEGLWEALGLLAEDVGMKLATLLTKTEKFANGTTQTSNAIFTWEGAKTGVLTTRGFADELLIMRAIGRVAGLSLTERRHLRATDKPHQIVPRHLIRELDERVDRQGRVLVPLNEEQVESTVRDLVDEGVESIAVSLLWSPRYPDHELLVERVVQEVSPEIPVTLSHRLAPVLGEYERVSTAAVNAFVAPTTERYLRRLERELQEAGLRAPLLVLQASGGVVEASKSIPVHTVESGPAAGLVAAASLGKRTGRPNVIATDVGGTTFKVGLVVDGDVGVTQQTVINQYALLMPMVDLVSIGAGGGSIAWAAGNRLRIGPQSAGSDPGPACYGWGGTEPTVTDADAVLGFLSPENFLGGRLPLHVDRARNSFEDLAEQLFDGDVVAAAAGVRAVVDSQMGDLVRKATIERGFDPREFSLFAYGGAGPLHAVGYARRVGVSEIVVPFAATVFSAYGAAASDLTVSRLRAAPPGILEDPTRLAGIFDELERQAREFLLRQDPGLLEVRCQGWADMRYARQLHDVRVPLPVGESEEPANEILLDAFTERYEALYGRAAILPDVPVEALRLGVDAVGVIEQHPLNRGTVSDDPDSTPSPTESRPVFWPEAKNWIDTAIYRGSQTRPGIELGGPSLIERPGTTIAVPVDATARIDGYGNAIVSLQSDAGGETR